MEDNLIELLESLNYPVYRQGSMFNEDSYPETFFTFWNNDSPDHAHYDNVEYGTNWDFNIYVYSSDPALTYSLLESARQILKAEHWIVRGKGFDVQSDEATHTGRGLNVYYLDV